MKMKELESRLALFPTLHEGWLQQEVQTYSLVRSPRMRQPGSHLAVQFLSKDQMEAGEVAFSV